MISPEQKDALSAPLNRANVKQRDQAGRKLDYIEGWHAIDEANRIFGFDGWERETVLLEQTSKELVSLQGGRGSYQQWRVSYIAKVRVKALGVVREGTGYGSGMGKPETLGDAIEGAVKEAETDAMKRALMTFGNPFGLALYDKTQANVVADEGGQEQRSTDQRSEVGRQEAARASKDQAARDTYSTLEKDMRKNKTKADLRRWIADPDVHQLRKQLPKDWDEKLREAAGDYGRDLPEAASTDDFRGAGSVSPEILKNNKYAQAVGGM